MIINNHRNYIESEIPWLREYPADWKLQKLKYLCDINTGSKDTQDKTDDGIYPFFVRSPIVEKLNEYTHDDEAIMTAGDGVGVGKVFHYYQGKFSAHQRVYVFTKFKNVIGKFLFYYLKSNLAFKVLSGNAKSTVDSLRRPMLSEFLVVIPPLDEQIAIANFLDLKLLEIDNLINSKEKLIKLLEEKRKSIITDLVTKGLNPNVKMKDSGLEWIDGIPEHWIIKRVKHIAAKGKYSFVDGPFGSDLKNEEYKDEGVPLIQLNNIRNGEHLFNNIKYVTEEKAQQLSKHTAAPEDLVIAKMAHPVGRSAIVSPLFKKYVIVADCIKLSLNEKYHNKFINYAMNTSYFISQAELVAGGITRLRINLGELKQLKIFIPPYQEQLLICDYLDKKVKEIDNCKGLVKDQIQKLKDYRQSLIYEAVTGKIDVRKSKIVS